MLHQALEKELRSLFLVNPMPLGAALTDLDGSDLVVHPKHMADQLRVQAIYTGLMLKRILKLNASQTVHDYDRLTLEGDDGTLLAIRIGNQHQLVIMLDDDAFPLRFETHIDDISTCVHELLKRTIL